MLGRALVLIAGMSVLNPPAAKAQAVTPACTDNSRQCMIAAATSYLQGIVHADGSKVLFAPNVRRTEQGNDTGRGEAQLRAALAKLPPLFGFDDPRFIVDEPNRQVVVFTLLRGDIKTSAPLLSEPGKMSQVGPVTVHLAERFKVENGLITEIEAIFFKQPGTSDGVSGWESAARGR